MKIICISGKAKHGKDTTAGFISDRLKSQGKLVLITHYADLTKYICRNFFNWDGKKNKNGRDLLQKVGTDIVRKKYPDYWVMFLVDMLTIFKNKWDYVLIPDCRFQNELEVMKLYFKDVVHIRVIRGNHMSSLTEEQQSHVSETDMDKITPDFYIWNNGDLEYLNKSVRLFVDKHILKEE